MGPDQLCDNLLKWLKTFDAGVKVSGPADISDGVIIATVLNEIEPLWFDQAFLSKIKPDVGDNWRLKVSNLRKVTQSINDCFSDSLELSIAHLPQPDANKLAEENSAEEAGRLLQLVLGVAVNCSRKQEYIKAIQQLEPCVQEALMSAITELMSRGAGAEPGDATADSLLDLERIRGMVTDLDKIKDERHKMQQRCFELDNQIVLLQNERSLLQAENLQLQKRLKHQIEISEESSPGPEHSQRYKQLREKLKVAEDEIYKLEATRDELGVKCEVMEKDLRETRTKNEELQRLADETRQLRDELDILRDTSSKVSQYETTLDTYKKRLEDMGDHRRQIKILEEKNTDLMQTNMELEEELKRLGSYRPQIDLYKKQVQQLHQQLEEESKKRDKAEFELKKLAEKMTALQNEKERLMAERDKLREANEELRLVQIQVGGGGSGAGSPLGSRPPAGDLGDTLEQIPTEVKEKLLRLQHENRQLKSQVSGGRHGQEEAYKALLEDLHQRDAQLQADNRRLNQRILELQSRLDEGAGEGATSAAAGAADSGAANSRLFSLEQELQNKTMQIGEMEIRLAEQAARAQEQQEQLSRRDAEMAAMEERYKKYLEKAKSVIRALDPKTAAAPAPAAASPDISVLRHQLAEKDRMLEAMEKENEKAKSIREAEERLITTAFYNFGSQMNRQAMEQRLANISGGAQSFLARQRQASTRRLHGNR